MPLENMSVKEAVPEDTPDLKKMMEEVLTEAEWSGSTPEEVWSAEELEALLVKSSRKIKNVWPRILILRIKGKMAGWGVMEPRCPSFLSHVFRMGLCIRKEHRGKGCGRRLLKAMIDYAVRYGDRNGGAGILLEVAEKNLPAVKLYASAGFLQVGCIPNGIRSLRGELSDLLLYYTPLHPAAAPE